MSPRDLDFNVDLVLTDPVKTELEMDLNSVAENLHCNNKAESTK